MKVSILTNMVAPYRVSLFKKIANEKEIEWLRVLTCVEKEKDRSWTVEKTFAYHEKRLNGFSINIKKGDDLRILHFRLGVISELLFNRPDKLIVGDASWTAFIGVTTCFLLGIPFIIWNEITLSSKVSNGVMSYLRRFMYKKASSYIASCSSSKAFLINLGCDSNKIVIANNSVDNEYYIKWRDQLSPQRSILRKSLDLENSTHVFLFVGKLISRKRIVETIEILSKISIQSDIHFLVVGTGPLEKKLRAMVSESKTLKVNFLGHLGPEDLCKMYVICDSVILLSSDEPWGMVVNEAMLFSKNLILTSSVGASEILKNNVSEIVCDDLHNAERIIIETINYSSKICKVSESEKIITSADMAEIFLKELKK